MRFRSLVTYRFLNAVRSVWVLAIAFTSIALLLLPAVLAHIEVRSGAPLLVEVIKNVEPGHYPLSPAILSERSVLTIWCFLGFFGLILGAVGTIVSSWSSSDQSEETILLSAMPSRLVLLSNLLSGCLLFLMFQLVAMPAFALSARIYLVHPVVFWALELAACILAIGFLAVSVLLSFGRSPQEGLRANVRMFLGGTLGFVATVWIARVTSPGTRALSDLLDSPTSKVMMRADVVALFQLAALSAAGVFAVVFAFALGDYLKRTRSTREFLR